MYKRQILLLILALCVCIAGLTLGARLWWIRRHWGILEELEFSSGLTVKPGETLKSYVDRVISARELEPGMSEDLRRLERQYESFKFGGHPVWNEPESRAWQLLCKEVKRQRS